MKKKFIRVMFFGALALTTFSYVGCKDYDDDIDRLEQKITENANAIAEINKLIEGGSVITKVENITGGVEVTLSNGKSFTIKNGDAGKDGTQWTIGDDGYWYYESVLPAGETTKQELNISYQFPSGDGKASEFNVVVIQECTPVLFDENGNAYADWNHAVTADSGDTQE